MSAKSTKLILLLLSFTVAGFAQQPSTSNQPPIQAQKILIHITHGTDNPTVAALGFLIARTALEEGHTVSLFLAGDGVHLLRDGVLDNLSGLGTGNLREHYDAIVQGGGKFYLSGMSSKSRNLTQEDIKGKPAELASPSVLLRLALEHDRMFTY